MSKTSQRSTGTAGGGAGGAEVPVVGGREPCPCGSGKRYKACHGRPARQRSVEYVRRPFEGLAGEGDWVALREIVPAATAPLTLNAEHRRDGVDVIAATLLPLAWPALRRADGSVQVGLQTPARSGDPSRDVARALLAALDAEPGAPVSPAGLPGPGPRLQDVLDPDAELGVTVHEGFDFWLEGVRDRSPEVLESLERANAAVVPTARLESVRAAYWCRIAERRHLRWVLPHDEDAVLDGLARLHAAGESGLGPGCRYVGSFRAHGLLVPVWDLDAGTEAAELEQPAERFEQRLGEAMATGSPLDADQRRARAGVVSRQLTLR
jgi:hypothetical protein